jgi:hypothetical protein
MVMFFRAQMNALAFAQYASNTHKPCASDRDWTIAADSRARLCVPEIIT